VEVGVDRARIAELKEHLRASEGLAVQRKSALRLLVRGTATPACDLCCTGMVAQGGGWTRRHKTGCGRLVCRGVGKQCAEGVGGGERKDRKGNVQTDEKKQITVISCFCKFVVAQKDFESDFMKEVAFVHGFPNESCSEEEGAPVPAARQAYMERSL
jgi:hypothetical protein